MRIFTLVLLYVLISLHALSQSVSVTTQRYDNRRSGWNSQETKLTSTSVNTNTFGLLFTRQVDDQIYAQPLILANLLINGATHNVVFIATVNNSVYAYDAENPASSTPFWHINVTPAGSRVLQNTDMSPTYTDFTGKIGIVGTPVIDTTTFTMYFVAPDMILATGEFEQYLHAIDYRTGIEKTGSPVKIVASYPGSGDGHVGNTVPYLPGKQNTRPGLLLLNGTVYVSSASYGDYGPYHGWVLGYNATTLQKKYTYNDCPDGGNAGIWMSGEGLVVDENGYIYLSTGNGTVGNSTNPNYYRNRGESLLKLIPSGDTMKLVDYFTPANYAFLNTNDLDYGVDGVLIIPNTTVSISGTKEGRMYVVSTSKMGKYSAGNDSVLQILNSNLTLENNIHGTPVYYHYISQSDTECVYVWPEGYNFQQYFFNRSTGLFDLSKTINGNGNGQGPIISVSSNGQVVGTGIVWASFPILDPNHQTRQGVLQAFDARDIRRQIWNSTTNSTRDSVGNYAKFNTPVVANGKVYLATFSNRLNVYGLFNTNPVPVTGVSMNPTTLSIIAGSSSNLTAAIIPSNATNQNVSWTSSNTSVASVDAFGKVTANAAGNATITVTTADGNKTATCAVTVTSTPAQLDIFDLAGTLTAQGDHPSAQTVAMAVDDNLITKWLDYANANPATRASWIQYQLSSGKFIVSQYTITSAYDAQERDPRDWNIMGSNDGINWSILDTRTGEVFANRTQTNTYSIPNSTAYSFYKFQINSVSNPSLANSVQLAEIELLGQLATSNVPVTGVSVTPTIASLSVGSSLQLTATVTPSNATNKNVNWTSSNIYIANVDANGKVTAVDTGSVVITVATVDGNNTATCSITAIAATTIPVTGVSLNPNSVSLFSGSSTTLAANISPANATNKNVTWSSNNTIIASVDATGKVTGNAVGNATVTVTTSDGNKTATCAVTVSAVPTTMDIFDLPGTLTAQGDHPPSQTVSMAVDDNLYTKWLDYANANPTTRASWLQYKLTSGQFIVFQYTITSGYDAQERDPRDWNLLGSNDGVNWTVLDTRTGEVFANRTQTNTYSINNTIAFSYYKFQINSVFNPSLANSMQLAEIELLGQVGSSASVPVTGVSLNQVTASLVVGTSLQLVATISPSNATNQNVTWNSNNTTIASVDATGKVTANAAGSAIITVTTIDGNKTATCTVTTTAANIPVTGVSVIPGSAILAVGNIVQLTANVSPANATNKSVNWSSSNTAVASVDATGKVTANTIGSATITVTTVDGNKTATCSITDTAAPVHVTSVSVSPTTAAIFAGNTFNLLATVLPANAANKNVTWSSSNSVVAIVDATGKVTGNAVGNATITVTSIDGSKTATCAVTVSTASTLTDIFDIPGTLTAQGDHPPVQTVSSAVDDNLYTKWLDFANAFPATRSSWLQYQLTSGQFVVVQYTITSGYDAQERDPRDWNLLGSNDGINWIILDTRTGEVFANRTQTNTYVISNTTPYIYYKFQINSVYNPSLANSMQLAELELLGQAVTLKSGEVLSVNNNILSEINIYPNPSAGEINIAGLPDKALVRIFDLTGKEYYNRMQSGNGIMEITDANLTKNMYIISIISGKDAINKKIIVR